MDDNTLNDGYQQDYNGQEDYHESLEAFPQEQPQQDFFNLVPSLSLPLEEVDFYENLAEKLDPSILKSIANDLLEEIDQDLDARKPWESKIKESIDLFGTEFEKELTYPFKNASGVYSPIFMECFALLSAYSQKEILPVEGPCKTKIKGLSDEKKEDQAGRMEDFANDYLTNKCSEFKPEVKRAMDWSIFSGNGFVKAFNHPISGWPTVNMVMPQDFIIARDAKNLKTANRLTEILRLTEKEIIERQHSGFYIDAKILPSDDLDGAETNIQDALNNMTGTNSDEMDDSEDYIFNEVHTYLNIKGMEHKDEDGEPTGIPLPYIVTIDKSTRNVVRLCRNWDKNDPLQERLDFYADFVFGPSINGRSPYALGMASMTGGASYTATAMLRQSIDCLTLNNFPGGVRVKGMRIPENTLRIGPTEFKELETGGVPLKDAIMPLPYNPLNPLTLQLLEKMEESVKSLTGTLNLKIQDLPSNMTATNLVLMMDQAHKAQSSYMENFHAGMKNLLKIIFRLFAECLPRGEPYYFDTYGKSSYIIADDFNDHVDIVPVSDPNLSSTAQRLAQSQFLYQMAKENPQLHNMRAILDRIYHDLKISNIDEFLIAPQEIQPTDPISENEAILKGGTANVGIYQDHASHITTHSWISADPSIAQNSPQSIPIALAHIREHTAALYKINMMQLLGVPMNLTPEQMQENQMALEAAKATEQMLMELQQKLQAQKPAPNTTEILMKEVEERAQYNQGRLANEAKKIELEAQKIQLQAQEAEANLQLKDKQVEYKRQTDVLNKEAEILKEEMKAGLKTTFPLV